MLRFISLEGGAGDEQGVSGGAKISRPVQPRHHRQGQGGLRRGGVIYAAEPLRGHRQGGGQPDQLVRLGPVAAAQVEGDAPPVNA